MEDPNKLLAELREWASHYNGATDEEWHAMNVFRRLDRALSSGMFFPDDWCRTKIKGEDS